MRRFASLNALTLILDIAFCGIWGEGAALGTV
jgi:hypothetical protein